jgi:DNA polymerase I-like protein with 3'-5' exonuclease and polymerase domains
MLQRWKKEMVGKRIRKAFVAEKKGDLILADDEPLDLQIAHTAHEHLPLRVTSLLEYLEAEIPREILRLEKLVGIDVFSSPHRVRGKEC